MLMGRNAPTAPSQCFYPIVILQTLLARPSAIVDRQHQPYLSTRFLILPRNNRASRSERPKGR
jgi:hypothetical protein